jgi:ppGpp synthetase/RelA/SpoT-type nucleotidyltranferase
MSPITRTILKEYTSRYTLYRDFCDCISSILEEMLKKGNYKYHINSRVKEKTSLQEKIIRKKKTGVTYTNIQDIEDMEGTPFFRHTL